MYWVYLHVEVSKNNNKKIFDRMFLFILFVCLALNVSFRNCSSCCDFVENRLS